MTHRWLPEWKTELIARKTGREGGRQSLSSGGGAIAGSATNLMDCLRIAVKTMGIPLNSAVKCATENPARSIGIYDSYGSIQRENVNVVLLDKDLEIKAVIKKGEILNHK